MEDTTISAALEIRVLTALASDSIASAIFVEEVEEEQARASRERHEREAEGEAAGGNAEQLPGHAEVGAPQVAHFVPRTTARTMKPT